MNRSEQILLNLLTEGGSKINTLRREFLSPLSMEEISQLYIYSAFLVPVMEFIKEQLWLKNNDNKDRKEVVCYEEFLAPFFIEELFSISFLKEFLIAKGSSNIREVSKNSERIESLIIGLIMERSGEDKRNFIFQSLRKMTSCFLFEENLQKGRFQHMGHKGPRLYRAFDRLDDVFNLNYQKEQDRVVKDGNEERLYQGAGATVQSGYSTILLAIQCLDSKCGSKVIDLGSGYGRVGLVYSVLRPDIKFVGYEYVSHRVDVSNSASNDLNLQGNLEFKTQDLSLESFKIPDADIYYLYDPFTEETYTYVLKQIVEVSLRKEITIVTKGNARSWLTKIASDNSWPDPILIDNGNLCIFKSSY